MVVCNWLMTHLYTFQCTGRSRGIITRMRIGELANRTGFTTKTIRYYEDLGLLPRPARQANGYRDYGEEAVGHLEFIADGRAAGLTLKEITTILELRSHGESTCEHVLGLLVDHLADLDRRVAALRQARRDLAKLTARAQSLDPANCQDPIRCQTISTSERRPVAHRARFREHRH